MILLLLKIPSIKILRKHNYLNTSSLHLKEINDNIYNFLEFNQHI